MRSLALTHPELCRAWHPTKNGDLTPYDVVALSSRRVWWQCPVAPDHEWVTGINKRTRTGSRKGTGCPFCKNRKPSPTNSLATTYPEVAVQWHPAKNGGLDPRDVPATSLRYAWWKCPEGPDHEWRAQIHTRTKLSTGCPCCSGRQASVTNSLATLFPNVARQWHPTRNGRLQPKDVPSGSDRRVWWKCPVGPDHEWRVKVSERTVSGHNCPYCSGHRVSVTNSLATVYPEIASQWHPSRNGRLKSEDVVAGANRYVWWKCPLGPDHEWRTLISHRTINGSGCPYCAGKNVSVTNSLATRFPEIAAQWHPTRNGKLTPHDVTYGSGKRIWWKCSAVPEHVWITRVTDRTANLWSPCPFCYPPATRRRRRRRR